MLKYQQINFSACMSPFLFKCFCKTIFPSAIVFSYMVPSLLTRLLFDYKSLLSPHAIATKLVILSSCRPLNLWPEKSLLLKLIACSFPIPLPSPFSTWSGKKNTSKPPSLLDARKSLLSTLNPSPEHFPFYSHTSSSSFLFPTKALLSARRPFFPAQALQAESTTVLSFLLFPTCPYF